jgi:predicted RNase H-like HicB family nuclease
MEINQKRKPLQYYLELKYPVKLIPAEEGGFAVQIEDLPGCYSQGETAEEAMEMIEEARKLWMESMYEDGKEIPLPSSENMYSGRFNVRVPASLHRELARIAGKEGVSLNQYIVYALSHATGVAETKRPYKTK